MPVTSSEIAGSLQTAPSLVRRIMIKLKKAGLLNAVQGAAQPTLVKSADQINLRDIYSAISTDRHLLNVDSNISKHCPIGSNMPIVLGRYYDEIQSTAEARMAKISLQDVIDDIKMQQQQHQA
ncbi:Rrf2 family transcriptional regulator [Oenococcus sicerae]|nr:Rrf2 family transcriptional regulator [Oenococcus sicerae]